MAKYGSPSDKTPPVHAASVWADGNKLYLTFPGYKGTEDRNFNSVAIDPFDAKPQAAALVQLLTDIRNIVAEIEVADEKHQTRCGEISHILNKLERKIDPDEKFATLEVMWTILKARCNASSEDERKIGTKATPVKYDLEKVQRYMAGKSSATAKQDISHLSTEDIMKELGL